MTPPFLEASGLVKRYGARTVLGPLDVSLPGGSIVAVMGPNGAGKSTLLGSLAGVLRCDGEVRLGGARLAVGGRRCAYLPQRIRLPGAATVDEVMGLFGSLVRGATDRTTPDGEFLPEGGRRIAELSGGQAQRVAIAGVVMGAPDLLLLDEPFANLDDRGRLEAARLLAAHRSAGALVLFASPAALDVLALADHVIEIDGGGLGFQGSPGEYRARLDGTSRQLRVGPR